MKRIGKIFVFNMFAILGRLYIKRHKPIIIGVTGSVGKTSCRSIIYQVFSQFLIDKKIYTSPKNYNSELGLVFSIFKFERFNYKLNSLFRVYFIFLKELIFGKKQYDILILEYGVDHIGDMDFLLKIAKPDYSVFTKLDLIHLSNFSKKEDILDEKFKLIENTKKKAYINFADILQRKKTSTLIVPYEYYNKVGCFQHRYIIENRKILAQIRVGNSIIKTNILGIDNFVYLELAIRMLGNFGIEYIKSQTYIPLKIQSGRFTLYNGIKKSVLVDSTYNAGPESMLKMLENVVSLRKQIFKDYKLLFVIGDMRELGGQANTEHKKLFLYLRTHGDIISIGPTTKETFGKHLGNFKYSKDAGKFLVDFLNNQDEKFLILFKGSQNTIYVEEALKEVLLDKTNSHKLVRQDKFWLDKKNNY